MSLLTLKNLSECSWRLGSSGKLNLGVSAIIGLSARSSGVGLSYEPKSSPMSRVSLQVHTSFSMVMGVKVPRYEAGRCGMSSSFGSRLNPDKFCESVPSAFFVNTQEEVQLVHLFLIICRLRIFRQIACRRMEFTQESYARNQI